MDPTQTASAVNPEPYFAELGAFDYFYNNMKLYVNPSLVQGQFIREGLINAATTMGGMAVFLPDHAKMEAMLTDVRGNIALNGPISFGKLFRVFNSIPTYQKLATELNKKQMELKDKAFSDKNIASAADTAKMTTKTFATSRNPSNIVGFSTSSNPTAASTAGTSTPSTAPGMADLGLIAIADKKVTMDIVVKVAPIVAVHWNDIGYRLRLDSHEMDIMEAEARSGDMRFACKKMMRAWIASTSGREPKTWKTFLAVLHELGINIDNVVDVLKKDFSLTT